MCDIKKCHDCGVKEGQIHELGCDMERCPFCGGQLISCECSYDLLNIDCSEGTDVYKNGLSKEQEEQWLEMLENKGRVPYIRWPNLCAYCGKKWPDMFHVPHEEWKKYIQIDMRDEMVCHECYEYIKSVIDSNV